jgi:hypothetical protein
MLLGEGALAAIRRARELLPQVRRAVLVPRLSLWTYRPLRFRAGWNWGAWIDDFILVLIGGPRPSPDPLQAISNLLSGFPREIAPVFQLQGLALGWTQRPEMDLGSSFDRPDLFPNLSRTTPLADGLELAGSAEWELALRYSDHFEVRANVLLGLVDSQRGAALPIRQYLVVFWDACRSALAAAQASQDVAEIPALSDQLAEALSAWTPDEAPTLRRLHEEYARLVQGLSNGAETYKDWARRYARRLREMLPPCQIGPLP